ncbi:uncharacterized protein LOC129741956 [Uranotaenia lowii]|uniref:uncharacterized protein LOC129741956 n=1 Tax=Uranotaenia lowii TaxID=190385 RepID=UPI00247B167A|nr:uncharacterized protein LOC129741956 [Uranotaenia lowii]
MLDELTHELAGKAPVVIGGDFNAWAVNWGSRCNNPRGHSLLESFARLEVELCNTGSISTYRKHGLPDRTSVIDITFVSPSLKTDMNWRVCDDYTHSDHQAIRYSVGNRNPVAVRQLPVHERRWKTKVFDKEVCTEARGTIQYRVKGLVDLRIISDQQDRRLKKCCQVVNKKHEDKRSKMTTLRNTRRHVKNGGSSQTYMDYGERFTVGTTPLGQGVTLHRTEEPGRLADRNITCGTQRRKRRVRERVEAIVVKAPEGTYADILRQMRTDKNLAYFGDNVRRIHRTRNGEMILKLKRGARNSSETFTVNAAEVLGDKAEVRPLSQCYPLANSPLRQEHQHRREDYVGRTSRIRQVSPTKEGPRTGRHSERRSEDRDQGVNRNVRDIVARYVTERVFSDTLKRQKLVLLPKPGKPPGDSSAYRRICLLDTAGKVLGKVIQNRHLRYNESKGGLSEKQFGFRRGRSTLDAIRSVIKIADRARLTTRTTVYDR